MSRLFSLTQDGAQHLGIYRSYNGPNDMASETGEDMNFEMLQVIQEAIAFVPLKTCRT